MRMLSLFSTLLVVGTAVTARGGDLTKIDRTIAKESAYQTKTPKYGLLVFGPEAKSRAWVVLDGDVLYVDRNCNGDLTEKGERLILSRNPQEDAGKKKAGSSSAVVSKSVVITDLDGAKHPITFRLTKAGVGLDATSQRHGHQYVGSIYRDDMVFAARPQDAPIVHLNGPLTLQLVDPPRQWSPGEKVDLVVLFGTPGLGKATFAYIIQGPPKTRPTAEIQFPAKNPGARPLVVKVALKEGSKPGKMFGG
ncbi:MAG TPA: hypothetical protein VKD71_05930 [Gemmataceae bacterium]|nr:hypothetical protein [Gemmataceae bacterium]